MKKFVSAATLLIFITSFIPEALTESSLNIISNVGVDFLTPTSAEVFRDMGHIAKTEAICSSFEEEYRSLC
ncbi:MAG: hypothetical protein WDZ40_01715, partial [Candidatus Spechtbacterales bacterium]